MERSVLAVAIPAVILPLVGVAWFMLSKAKPFLEGKNKKKRITILDIKSISHDTKRFRLDLGTGTPLGLPVGKHLQIHAPNPEAALKKGTWNGREDKEKSPEIVRPYTPTPNTKMCGHVDLVIKIYRPGTVVMPDGREFVWEDGGKLSLHLDSKSIGDTLEISGPVGAHEYIGCGDFKKPGGVITSKHYGLLAGGAGITPMLQLVYAAIHDPNDITAFSLIYANKTEGDILCRDILDELVDRSNGQFVVHYTLDFPPEGWKHKRGFISDAMIKDCLPPPEQKPVILMCGPPPMIEYACKPNLEKLGYPKQFTAAL